MYCTYITFYRGNLLPPFYIGHSTEKKIARGYHGSVSSKRYKAIWLSELKNNPRLFRTLVLSKHNTKQEAAEKEAHLQRLLSVHTNPMYTNMAIAIEKFVVTDNSYRYQKRGPHKKETKDKMSQASKGIPKSDKHKKNLSIARRSYRHSEETYLKISAALKAKEPVIKECPHCGTIGKSPNIYRRHFDKCQSL